MRIFISQPMKDKTNEQIKETRKNLLPRPKKDLVQTLKLLIVSLKMHHTMLNRYGFWLKVLKCYQLPMLLILQRVGKKQEDVESKTPVLLNMALQ